MSHCPDCNEDHWDAVVGGHVACPGCGHEERIAALEAKLAEAQAEVQQARTWTWSGIIEDRDALRAKFAEAQQDALAMFRFAAATTEKNDALRATLDTLTPHGMNDVRALWANGKVCEDCSHSLCQRVRKADATLGQTRVLTNATTKIHSVIMRTDAQSLAVHFRSYQDAKAFQGALAALDVGKEDGPIICPKCGPLDNDAAIGEHQHLCLGG